MHVEEGVDHVGRKQSSISILKKNYLRILFKAQSGRLDRPEKWYNHWTGIGQDNARLGFLNF